MTKENFTIEDIHRIRYNNYEKTKCLSHAELIEYTKKEAEEARKMLESIRKNQLAQLR